MSQQAHRKLSTHGFCRVQNYIFAWTDCIQSCWEKVETAERREEGNKAQKQIKEEINEKDGVPLSKCSHPWGLAELPAASL